MKNKQHFIHSITLFLILTGITVILSWLLHVYGITVRNWETGEELSVQNLLSQEGIRWMVRHSIVNFITFPFLGEVVIASFGIGLICHSGLLSTFRRYFSFNKVCCLSRKEARSLITSIGIGTFYLLGILWITFFSDGILLSAMGTLQHSPLLSGIVFLLSLGAGIMGAAYGFSIEQYHTGNNLIEGMTFFLRLLGIYLVMTFFASLLHASLCYSQIAICIPFFDFYPSIPILLSFIHYFQIKSDKID